jgi:hypothetical protein
MSVFKMKKIIILTGNELRHTFFRKNIAASDKIKVLNSYCEGDENSFLNRVKKEDNNDLREKHLTARMRSEMDFFSAFIGSTEDNSHPVFIPKGKINEPEIFENIIAAAPDLIVAYGCSLIKEPLLIAFKGRFLNIHLGLSPYYRGAGTNYWPLVNNEPEYVGATFMHINAGVDTGEIIHQMRAKIVWGDTPVQIGNRLITEMSVVCRDIIINFGNLAKMPQLLQPPIAKYYKEKDYSEDSVAALYENFKNGLIERYLVQEALGCQRAPIIQNPGIQ